MNAEERTKRIAARKEELGREERLWCKGERRNFPIYRVEVDALLLNADNRRFKAERILMQHQLGRTLDPEASPTDEQSIISILLDTSIRVDGDVVVGIPTNDTLALEADWLRRDQDRPFWIRPDGTVRNGNRRLAIVKRLRAKGGGDALGWIHAIILPESIDEGDLFEMEQREQLTEEFKVRYTDVNLLLSLREAAMFHEIDWADEQSIGTVARELQWLTNGDTKYAVKQLRAIKYMDAYLLDSNAPGEYHKLLRQVERFRDVGWVMGKMEDYTDHQQDMLRLCFAALRAGNPHGHIRKLWDIFLHDRGRYEELLTGLAEDEADWEKAQSIDLPEPDLSAQPEDDEDDDGDDEEGPSVPNYPARKVKDRIENAVDGFLARNRDVPQILTQALDRLTSLIDPQDRIEGALAADDTDQTRDLLSKIIAWADDAKQRYR